MSYSPNTVTGIDNPVLEEGEVSVPSLLVPGGPITIVTVFRFEDYKSYPAWYQGLEQSQRDDLERRLDALRRSVSPVDPSASILEDLERRLAALKRPDASAPPALSAPDPLDGISPEYGLHALFYSASIGERLGGEASLSISCDKL